MSINAKNLNTLSGFIKNAFQLCKPFWQSKAYRKYAWGYLLAILAVMALQLYIAKEMSYASADLFNSLDNRIEEEIFTNLYIWTGLVAGVVALWVLITHLRMILVVYWREFLTKKYIETYLNDGTYNQMQLKDYNVDNPDQRIAMDMFMIADETLQLALNFIQNIGTLFVYGTILWTVSGEIALPIGEMEVVIPGYMFWIAVIYAIIATYLTHKFGKPLTKINFEKQHVEADFRYQMVRIRENSESITLLSGEKYEKTSLEHGFNAIKNNWFLYTRYTKRLVGLNFGFSQLSMVFPYLAAMPAFLAGTIAIGSLIQLRGAFFSVELALSWFANTYSQLAAWKSSVDRALTLQIAMDNAILDKKNSEIKHIDSDDDSIKLTDLSIELPDGHTLINGMTGQFNSGESVVITGTSGSGKSTLFRALSGQWLWGKGDIQRNVDDILFLPQRPYLPHGDLKSSLVYPKNPADYSDNEIKKILKLCLLDKFIQQLHEVKDWQRTLSGGEQQRVSIARALIANPKWLFMDESTSALDTNTECSIYQMLKKELTNTTLISIAHKASLKQFHDVEYNLNPISKQFDISAVNTN